MSFTQDLAPATAETASVATSLLQHLQDAWNAADGASFGAVFTEDCDFVDIRGEHHQGAIAVGAGHQAILDSIYRGSTVSYTAESVREVAPGVVVAVAGARLECPSGPLQGVNRSRLTLVVVQSDGTWSVAAFHNTLLMQQR